MSNEKNRIEAQRWLHTADPDIAFNEEDADTCIEHAGIIIGAVHNLFRNGYRIPEPYDRPPSTGDRQS
jgi:hypothetical protein